MKNLNKILAAIVFVFSLVVYILTMAPTTSFWDCGEFIATSVIMGVPHPPGTPFYLLLGNFFSQIPIFDDLGSASESHFSYFQRLCRHVFIPHYCPTY